MASQMKEYDVTNPEVGFFYQREIAGYILVKLMKLNAQFQLCPECKDAHPFDDIAFNYKRDGENCHRLMQCKHKKNRELTLKHLLSKGKSNPFNMSKYLTGYKNIKEKIPYVYDLIMCTNAEWKGDDIFNEGDDHLLEGLKVPNAKETFKETCSEDSEEHFDEFFDKFKFWFTSNIGDIKTKIHAELITEIDGYMMNLFHYKLKEIVEARFMKFRAESITHENLTDLRTEILREKIGQVSFEFTDPVFDFHGMEYALTVLRNAGNIAVVHGPEGVGKTQLARKFASEERFEHRIWIDAQSDSSIEEAFRKLAFQKLRIIPKDFAGNSRDLSSIAQEVCNFFERGALFIFDGAKDYIGILPTLQRHSVLITTREDNFPHEPKIELTGFTEIEARDYIMKHLPDENDEDVAKLARHCDFLPMTIVDYVNNIKAKKKIRSNLNLDCTISEFLP